MKDIILGTGISGFIIAACLDKLNKDFIIVGNLNDKSPSILYLKYNNKKDLARYFDIFNIEYNDNNIKEFTKKVRIGYLWTDGIIHESATDAMIECYYHKQNRVCTKSGMSDGISTFNAIDLHKVYTMLKDRYSSKVTNTYIDTGVLNDLISKYNPTTIYNTIFLTICNYNGSFTEYIKKETGMPTGFDYVYDCRPNSIVKRYTETESELIAYDGSNVIKVNNYYESPKIYSTYDVKRNINWIDISRKATKTQLKQEDIIKYMLGNIK